MKKIIVISITLICMILFVYTWITESSKEGLIAEQSISNTDEIKKTSSQEEFYDPKAALKFMNGYLSVSEDGSTFDTSVNVVTDKRLVTSDFIDSYREIIEKAYEDDPELGLGFDPILDAQDSPDRGFTIEAVDGKYVTLAGVDWTSFKVRVKLAKEGGITKVDGAGIINISEEKQIKR